MLTEREQKILETLGKVIPELSELEREKLLSFGEGKWMWEKYGSEDSPSGDLARDLHADTRLEYQAENTLAWYVDYLVTNNACDQAIATLCRCWMAYGKWWAVRWG